MFRKMKDAIPLLKRSSNKDVEIKVRNDNSANEMPGCSGIVKKIAKYLVCMILSIGVTLFVETVSSELLVLWYMRANQIVNRSDLSEDYGLAMLGVFLSTLVFIICFPLSFFIVRKLLKKYYG